MTEPSSSANPLISCAICLEDVTRQELGELSSCAHRFCWPCISQWSRKENKCPLCKERFIVLKRKRLRSSEIDELQAEADEAGGELPLKRLKGQVLETQVVEERTQEWRPEEILALNLEQLRCEICHRGDDDTNLLLCDGCDRGFHTYCCNLPGVPLDAWYCRECEEEREVLRQAAARRTTRRAAASAQQQQNAAAQGRGASRGRQQQRGGRAVTRGGRGPNHDDDIITVDSEEDEFSESEEDDEGETGEDDEGDDDQEEGDEGGEEDDVVLVGSGDEAGDAGPSSSAQRSGRGRRPSNRRRARSTTGRRHRRRRRTGRRRGTRLHVGSSRRSRSAAHSMDENEVDGDEEQQQAELEDESDDEMVLAQRLDRSRMATTARTRALLASMAAAAALQRQELANATTAVHARRVGEGVPERAPLSARRTAANARQYQSQRQRDTDQVGRLRDEWHAIRSGSEDFASGGSGAAGGRSMLPARSAYVGAYGTNAPSGQSDSRARLLQLFRAQEAERAGQASASGAQQQQPGRGDGSGNSAEEAAWAALDQLRSTGVTGGDAAQASASAAATQAGGGPGRPRLTIGGTGTGPTAPLAHAALGRPTAGGPGRGAGGFMLTSVLDGMLPVQEDRSRELVSAYLIAPRPQATGATRVAASGSGSGSFSGPSSSARPATTPSPGRAGMPLPSPTDASVPPLRQILPLMHLPPPPIAAAAAAPDAHPHIASPVEMRHHVAGPGGSGVLQGGPGQSASPCIGRQSPERLEHHDHLYHATHHHHHHRGHEAVAVSSPAHQTHGDAEHECTGAHNHHHHRHHHHALSQRPGGGLAPVLEEGEFVQVGEDDDGEGVGVGVDAAGGAWRSAGANIRHLHPFSCRSPGHRRSVSSSPRGTPSRVNADSSHPGGRGHVHGHRHGHGHDRARECGVGVDRERAALKEAAANAVKDALKDLYARRQIDKEMFKSLAQSATHTVCGDVAAGRLSRQALLAGDTVAALTAVRGALAAAGLGHLHP